MANEVHGHGSKLQRWNGTAFEDVANVVSISGPGYAKDTLETTDLQSTDKYRTYIGGLKDAGEASFTLNYATAQYAKLQTDFEDADPVPYKIILSDTAGTSFEFAGIVTAVPLEIPFDEKITAEVTIKITGKPVIS